MGYTHYFGASNDIPQGDWDSALEDVKDIIERHKDLLCGDYENPDSKPVITSDRIFFNTSEGVSGETFVLGRTISRRGYCKTNRYAYDQAVCECLLVLRARISGFRVSSDGFSADLSDPVLDGTWLAAIEAVKKYGLHYEPYVSNKRPPFCDLGMRLTEDGVDGVRVFDEEGDETREDV